MSRSFVPHPIKSIFIHFIPCFVWEAFSLCIKVYDCLYNKYKMDLTTNGVVITDAIKFVQTNKEKLMSKEDDKESKEPDYEEDKDQIEEKQEEETWLVIS
jgi:hypothetical protein